MFQNADSNKDSECFLSTRTTFLQFFCFGEKKTKKTKFRVSSKPTTFFFMAVSVWPHQLKSALRSAPIVRGELQSESGAEVRVGGESQQGEEASLAASPESLGDVMSQ